MRKWVDNTVSNYWTADELKIFALYGGKCILAGTVKECQKKAVTLHEIIPKSKRPKDWNTPENRVPMCNNCHRMVHDKGAKNYVNLLRGLQKCQKEQV